MGVGASVSYYCSKLEKGWTEMGWREEDQHVKVERLHVNHSLKDNLREAFRATRNRVVV